MSLTFYLLRLFIFHSDQPFEISAAAPTLMLTGGGTWTGILVGVFLDKFPGRIMTDLIWVGHSSTEEDVACVYRFARLLNALHTSDLLGRDQSCP